MRATSKGTTRPSRRRTLVGHCANRAGLTIIRVCMSLIKVQQSETLMRTSVPTAAPKRVVG
jgi:hypothetical protein